MQLDIFNTPDNGSETHHFPLEHGELLYFPAFYTKEAADTYFGQIRAEAQWKQETIQMYGRNLLTPRLTAWYGEAGAHYQFSGTKFEPHAWLDSLRDIKRDINRVEPASFNSVLLNLYRNGNDSVSWHTDAEPELGINPIIASVNFGASRRFMLRRIDDHSRKMELVLKHGSLLIMKGELQHHWQHQVPKTSQAIGERINLTYRFIYQ